MGSQETFKDGKEYVIPPQQEYFTEPKADLFTDVDD